MNNEFRRWFKILWSKRHYCINVSYVQLFSLKGWHASIVFIFLITLDFKITYSSVSAGGSSISIPPALDLKHPIGNSIWVSFRTRSSSSRQPRRPSDVGAKSLNVAQVWAKDPNISRQIGGGLLPKRNVRRRVRETVFKFAGIALIYSIISMAPLYYNHSWGQM